MQISQLVWNEDIIEHITRHNVTPEEVEEVCFGNPLILKSKQSTKGLNTLYYAMGRTDSGRHLFNVFTYFQRGRAMLITARDMDDMEQVERKYYRRRVEK
ncbi:MAG TPA: hypothetical protein DCK87_08625 [Desulfotomaculum sp.]|nr:hypothetical protein [Desulfotomaculum sp.]